MKALTFSKESGVVFHEEYPEPTRKGGEALIKTLLSGICNTDLEICEGFQDFSGMEVELKIRRFYCAYKSSGLVDILGHFRDCILGHEFVGVVVEVDPNTVCKVGDRVVGEINIACDQCEICEQGGVRGRNHCPKDVCLGIRKKNGTFAEFLTLPVRNLHVVPDEISNESAVFTEPLAAAFRIKEQGLVETNSSYAVIGDGKLGLLIAQVLNADGVTVMVIGKHAHKMAILSETITKHVLSDSTGTDFQDKFDVVVEASGTPHGLTLASRLTRPLGTIVLKSTCALATAFNTAPFVIKELKIIGSRCGNFPMALDALKKGLVQPQLMVTETYNICDSVEAMKHAKKRDTLKILLSF